MRVHRGPKSQPEGGGQKRKHIFWRYAIPAGEKLTGLDFGANIPWDQWIPKSARSIWWMENRLHLGCHVASEEKQGR
jgi:hypothetical protein